MPLDPQTMAVLNAFTAARPADMVLDAVQMRAGARASLPPLEIERALVASVEDRDIPGPAGAIPIRVYTPTDADRLGDRPPVFVYFHGGGGTVGSLDGWDGLCCQLTHASGCVVVSVDYRLAPENKFPAGVEDAEAAVRWAAANGTALGADGSRLVVGGDSAGANLSAVVCVLARDHGGPAIAMQVLYYPQTTGDETPSRVRNGDGYLLTKTMMRWFNGQYLRTEADEDDPRFAVLKVPDLSGLPPALVMTAEFDPLLDEGEAYANRLSTAGVAVDYRRYDGTIHGFLSFYQAIGAGREAIAETGKALRRRLA